jgi:hypothetical protein
MGIPTARQIRNLMITREKADRRAFKANRAVLTAMSAIGDAKGWQEEDQVYSEALRQFKAWCKENPDA